jgi:predicted nucleic acid-binding protein
VYRDTTYIAKSYLKEPESPRVRVLVTRAGVIYSSLRTFTEFHSVLHRQVREGHIMQDGASDPALRFSKHAGEGWWNLIPVHERLLRRTAAGVLSAPRHLPIRAGDAIHLATASDSGESEVWTSDRHRLAAAPYFGLAGRSV